MGFFNSGLSAIGRLAALSLILAAFLFGLGTVVYLSLQGSEIKVPEITGKNLSDSEKELASLGLKIKKRTDRFSAEEPGTVIEQLPKAGETVKTGQLILVVTSKGPGEGGVTPPSLKTSDEDDSEKIEEMISEKPKKPKANSNTNTNRKKADTTRDVNAAPSKSNSDSNSENSNSSPANSNKATDSNKSGANNNSVDKANRNTSIPASRLPNPTTKPSTGERPKRPQR